MIQFVVNFIVSGFYLWQLDLLTRSFASKKCTTDIPLIAGGVVICLAIALVNTLYLPFLNLSVSICAYIVFILLFYNTRWYYAFMCAFFIWALHASAELILFGLMSLYRGAPVAQEIFRQDAPMTIGQLFGVVLTLSVALSARAFMQKRKGQIKLPQNLAVILYPLISVMMVAFITSTAVKMFSHEQTVAIGVFLSFIIVLVNVASLIGNEHVKSRYILQNEIDAMQHQEELTLGLMRQQEEHLRETKAQAHDFKNHLLCLRGLVNDEQADQNPSLRYIDELLLTVGDTELYIEVKNEALRAILAGANATCKAKNIDLRCRVDYSDFSFMSYSDISILFSNAINNAIEACTQYEGKKRPYVDFKVLRQGEMLFVQIANIKSGSVKTQGGMLLSTKPQPENHGIGFKNMERVVRKYGGEITVDYEETEFRLYINLPLETE